MDFLVYSRDATTASALRDDDELLEAHWSYMDRYAQSMIARGPTLDDDRETATGSLHIVGLPSIDAVNEFVAHEPNNLAGLYAEHDLWRFENVLGRTMWQFVRATDEPLFLVIARSDGRQQSIPAELRSRLIVYGTLSTLVDNRLVGVALAVPAPNREALDALLDVFSEVEVHNWEFGGRR